MNWNGSQLGENSLVKERAAFAEWFAVMSGSESNSSMLQTWAISMIIALS